MKPEILHDDASPELKTRPDPHFNTASEMLLTPSGLDLPKLQGVLGSIMSHHVDYADLYFQYSRAESWGLEEGQVKSGNFSIDQGVGVRAVSGEKTA
ncbi:MAG TPA: DNA gyrase modulator, partial [Methylophilaceae bacterium]|nr:DNA gyrase modulator [Methylophilaceae bacterium]